MRDCYSLSLLAICFLFLNVNGQELKPDQYVQGQIIPIENIGIDKGLSQGMVNSIVEDSTGYLWVATKDGLNRYDGRGFKVFRHNHLDTNSVSENFIYSLLVDSKNRLWVGTQAAGVCLFVPSQERFIRFDSRRLGSSYIGELYEDPAGNILVETLDDAGFHLIMVSEVAEHYPDPEKVPIKTIREVYPVFDKMHHGINHSKFIHFDNHGALWYFNQDTIHYVETANGKLNEEIHKYSGYMSMKHFYRNTSTFLENDDGSLYISDWNRSLYKFNRDSRQFAPVLRLPSGLKLYEKQIIDTKNRLWGLLDNGEILRLDLNDGTSEYLVPTWQKLLSDMSSLHTGFNLQDKNGNLWIGTGGTGLLKISGKVDRFKRLTGNVEPTVGSIRTYRVETAGKKAVYVDSVYRSIGPLLNNPQALYGEDDDFRFSGSSSHITMDDSGRYWFGSYDQTFEYLSRIDPESVDLKKVFQIPQDSGEWVTNPVFLDEQNRVWFGEKYSNHGINLYCYNPSTDSLSIFPFPIDKGKFKYRFISDWEIAPDGTIWLGTMSGVFAFNPTDETWEHFAADPADPMKLSSNLVLGIHLDQGFADSILWVGTEGGGLNRLNIETGNVQRFTKEKGLPNNVVYAVQSDVRGNLWISTNYGLCLFDPERSTTTNFTTHDGLPHNEFNRYEFSKSENGELYFGSMGGVVHFSPNDFYLEGKEHKPLISSLTLYNRKITYGDTASSFRLPAPIERCKELVFDHSADMISFGFSLLDLTTPEKNRFRYQMIGLSDEWIEIEGNATATFTDLTPGDYVLKVVGMGSDNLWSTEPTIMNITVLTPWNASWWFRSLIMLVFLLLTYLLYRYRLNQALRMERMRNGIAQDLHDEIGSTLSSVSLFSSVLKQKLGDSDEKSAALLDKISSSVTEMMESMNDLVWTLKADNDRFELVINRMRAFAVGLCEAKGIQLKFKADNKADDLNLDMQVRKNVYLIFKEAVNNAIKYSKAETLYVVIEVSDRELHILVEDDGTGFDKDDVTRNALNLGGNGLKGMHTRAKEVGAVLKIRSEQGTCVDVWVQI